MALNTYSDVLAAVQDFLGDRTDLAGQVPNFFALVEARANRRLRTRSMETTATLTPSSGAVTIPDGYLEYRAVIAKTNPRRTLELIDQNYADEFYGDGASGVPSYFTVSGATMTIYPPSTDDIELRYYTAIPALTVSNTTNWLLTKDSRVYIDGGCMEASRYQQNWEAAAMYEQRFERCLDEIDADDKGGRWARGAMRIRGQTP